LNTIISFISKNLALNKTPSQGSDYYWLDKNITLTADIATSGEADGTLVNGACSVTLATPPQLVAWWMLTFPVDTVYIINVKINYRYNSKCFFLSVHFN
jgi:hypothetical protein